MNSLKHRHTGAFWAGLLLSCAALSTLQADDTEIFFGQADDAFNNNPNILFVLDNSGSMTAKDAGFGDTSRMDRLKTAMSSLLDQSSSFNVGLMAFQGRDHGGAIRYPIGYLEAESTELCDGICPDELIVARPDGGSNDGTENDISKEISLHSATLVMANVESATEDTSEAEVIETTGTATASTEVVEYSPTDASTLVNEHDQLTNRWFHDGVAEHGISLFAYRFDDVQIPTGATVTSATITFTQTNSANQSGDVAAYISAEATPLPQAYPTSSNGTLSLAERIDPLRRTKALVRWEPIPPDSASSTPPATGTDIKADTPEIASVVAELVSQPGWAEGGSMSFLLSPVDSYSATGADIREFYGSVAAANRVPLLSYTYHEAPNPDLMTSVLNASAHVDEVTEQNTEVVSRNSENEVSQLFHAGSSNHPRQLALRFDNISIPKDAIIKNAYLTMTSASESASLSPDDDWTTVEGSGNEVIPDETDSSSVDPSTDPADLSTDTDPADSSVVTAPDEPDSAAANPTLSINIHAELSASPENYGSTVLDERTHSSTFIPWENIPDAPDTSMSSPDISALVSDVIALEDWNSGNSISLRLSATEDYSNSADNSRHLLTAVASEKPELRITWEPSDTDTDDEGQTQKTAIRFSYVHIPPGAQIKSAKIVFHSAKANDEATSLDISAEKIASSQPLTVSSNNIGSRDRTTAQETWEVDPWLTVGTAYDTPDLTRIVQELTDQPEWCGGNPMTFILSGSGERVAVSADANSIDAPTLQITYAPDSVPTGAYCSNSSVVSLLSEARGDAVQNISSNVVTLNGASLNSDSNNNGTGDKQILGLRFDDVNIPNDTRIVSATLRLTTNEEIADTAQFKISVEDEDNASVFSTSNKDISSRKWSGDTTWESTPPVAANESIFTSDLKSLVSKVVTRSNWQRGNAMAFLLEPSQLDKPRSFASFDVNEANSAQLIIYFESERTSPGTRFRDNLKQHVNELVAMGSTPITSSLYEAALYFRGEPVDYGTQRGKRAWADRFHRVSHPFSYTGGELSRPAGCSDADLDSDACIQEIIYNNSSTATYISPLESQCQTNHIVLLSDGSATSNSASSRIQAMTGGSCDNSYSSAEQCGRELAAWMNTTDHSSTLIGLQNITTHTIAFNLAESDRGYLADLAELGGGGAYSADSTSSLLTAFQSIFLNVSKTDTSFVAPAVTLSQQNRMKNRDDLYYAVFKPESTARWNGNLKKYKLKGDENELTSIVDQELEPVIDDTTGNIKPGSKSFWSSIVDGSSVKLGGAAEQIRNNGSSHLSRNVYTYTGKTTDLTHSDNQLLPDNDELDPDWFSLSPSLAADADYYRNLVDWAHGKDVLDVDGDENTDEPRGQMGDPMHSQPLLLNYASGTDVDSIVFVSTNDGYLHAIDTDTGKEKFAFVPKELLKNMNKLMANEPTLSRPYGLDGGMTTWIQDDNNNGIIDDGDKAYLYVAMRRGGSQYYALDVSHFNNPKYLWSIQGRTNTLDTDLSTADGDFVELGDTWSRPIKTRVRDGSSVVDVLVFGGGYDPNQDPTVSTSDSDTSSSRSTDGVGRAIFIVNARTGAHMWQTNRTTDFPSMEYSIPSEVRVIDIDFDGLADQLYVGDMGGQIWRLDINNDSTLTDSLAERIDGGRIAELAGIAAQDARRFYYPPDVSIIATDGYQQLAISIGSGWRAHPLDDVVQDRFYSLRSPYVYGKPIDSFGQVEYQTVTHATSDLVDVSDIISPTLPVNSKGWFIDLEGTGEKVLSSSVTADNKVLFTSYLPEVDSVACSAAEGGGAVYALDVMNGSPVLDLNNSGSDTDLTADDRSRLLLHAGIPPPASVLFPESGNASLVIGTEKIDEFNLGELRRRTFWQEKIEENSL
ncbi:PilC/PilY family type IV pilus protein [Granulosicoccus antarcticus]|uniref:PilY1 beta-propeller domain-containing protein n=1 Tax=Granulosicoccus antarcticus IMCC3135 TaxID=1192854 RepID=A0A2Z2NMG8_9GAMM|nr:PilC/PilY family type IV pilus protein [Granulosicoccus antarcticus]ASJ72399.1 hypothetical protein IMCC3135_11545 [Granulosicoccus antarcticus IMCC3135]